MLTKGGKATYVGHQDSDLTQVAPQFQSLGAFQYIGDDLIRQVATEGCPDEFFVALQLLSILFFPVVPALALYASLDARLQQYGVERFEQIIIGAGLDTFNDAVHVLAT